MGVWGTTPLQREQQGQSPKARARPVWEQQGSLSAGAQQEVSEACRALGLSRSALGSRDFEQRGGVISPPSSSLSCCHVETGAKGAAEDAELLFRGYCSK